MTFIRLYLEVHGLVISGVYEVPLRGSCEGLYRAVLGV